MTAATAPRAMPPVRLAFRGLLRSELFKLTSLRSTRVAALVSVVLVAAGMTLRAWSYSVTPGAGVSSIEAWRAVGGSSASAGEIPVVVLAVLAVGSEYTNRAVLSTFIAAPRRLAVLAAKVLETVAAVAVVAALGSVLGMIVATPVMRTAGLAGPSLDVVGPAVSQILLLMVFATFALGVTVLVRSTAGGITIVLAVLLVLSTGIGLLSAATRMDLLQYDFSYAASMATAAISDPAAAHGLGQALAVTCLWLLVPVAAAAAALLRRDA